MLRRADFSLSDEQEALRDNFKAIFERSCPIDRVKEAGPVGYDEKIWRQLLDMRVVAMGVPEESGGDGAGLVELVLVAEQLGSALAPVPLIDALTAARLLARVGASGASGSSGASASASAWAAGALDGSRLVTVALHPASTGSRSPQLVPSGAIADAAIGLVGDELVLLRPEQPPAHVANHGSTPLARYDFGASGPSVAERLVLATGEQARRLHADAVREWKLLSAAALVGLADGALRRGVEFAIGREAFGAPIATFQAVSHPLVDVAMAVTGTRRLVWKAAWYADNEPGEARDLVPMAYLAAAEAGMKGPTVGVHVQGGLGFTVESDMHLYFRRARGWTLVAGDPSAELDAIADIRFGPTRA
jgi:alkylation response protein AidB-like acyl-CoA dehydrogenase